MNQPPDSADRSPANPTATPVAGHDPYAPLRLPNFRRYWAGNIVATLGMQMQSTAFGWEVYERTGSKMSLAYIGLVQVVPVFIFGPYAGQIVDRLNRRSVLMTALAVIAASSTAMAALSGRAAPIWSLFACIALTAVARTFLNPAKGSFMPQLAPKQNFSGAVAWASGGFHLASVVGPAVGGMVVAATLSPAIVIRVLIGMSPSPIAGS